MHAQENHPSSHLHHFKASLQRFWSWLPSQLLKDPVMIFLHLPMSTSSAINFSTMMSATNEWAESCGILHMQTSAMSIPLAYLKPKMDNIGESSQLSMPKKTPSDVVWVPPMCLREMDLMGSWQELEMSEQDGFEWRD
jgi:hypothetical protein